MSSEDQASTPSTPSTEGLSKNALKKQLKAAKAAQAKAEKEAAKVRLSFYYIIYKVTLSVHLNMIWRLIFPSLYTIINRNH
jgi:hypothetical protein